MSRERLLLGLVALLAARDAAGLRRLLVQHLDHKRDAVLEQLRAGTLMTAARA